MGKTDGGLELFRGTGSEKKVGPAPDLEVRIKAQADRPSQCPFYLGPEKTADGSLTGFHSLNSI
jgi:hypothetical protein